MKSSSLKLQSTSKFDGYIMQNKARSNNGADFLWAYSDFRGKTRNLRFRRPIIGAFNDAVGGFMDLSIFLAAPLILFRVGHRES